MNPTYDEIFLRNKGYISAEVQAKIRATRLLIAGCGIGSTLAEAAARTGFEQFILVDADQVETHNLNRQAFTVYDVGEPKVQALAKRIIEINPLARISAQNLWVDANNISGLVEKSDLVFDTIDFLDLAAIVALHDEANRQGRPVISCVSAGWGAAAVYLPPRAERQPAPPTGGGESGCYFRQLFGLPAAGPVENASYVKHFKIFIERIGAHLDPDVVEAMAKALTIMEDGTPCPAPHVAAGAYAVASLAVTMAVRLLAGRKVTAAPHLVLANMGALASGEGIDLS